MKTALLRALPAALAAAAALVAPALGAPDTPRVLAVEFENDVNPVTADFLNGAIERANDEDFDAVVILLDTPGGLAESMRKVVKRELESRVPVLVYVSPDGARAASAGVWIGQAADVLAMAPGTNIGSATPVGLGGENIQEDLRRKVVNDAAASLRALARTHDRNVAWVDEAVRRGSNIDASEARDRDVIDVIAPDLTALLERVDGRRTIPKGLVLHTAGARVERLEMSIWDRILDLLIDPNIVALMLSIGLIGIVVELWHPGLVFPGTVGAVSLVVSLYGLSVLPVSWAGILLLVLAAAFFAAEPFVVSHGALSVGGAVCFVIGSLMLFNPAGDAYQVSPAVALSIAGTLALFMAVVVAKIVQVRRAPVEVDVQRIVGSRGHVRRGDYVLVNGELWRARPVDDEPLAPGDEVEVVGLDGLVVDVRPVERTA